jgi:phage gp16-like protein
VLNKELDFDGTRLRCVADGVKSMVKIMNDKTLSKDFTIDDCVKYLKEKFNIDVHEME